MPSRNQESNAYFIKKFFILLTISFVGIFVITTIAALILASATKDETLSQVTESNNIERISEYDYGVVWPIFVRPSPLDKGVQTGKWLDDGSYSFTVKDYPNFTCSNTAENRAYSISQDGYLLNHGKTEDTSKISYSADSEYKQYGVMMVVCEGDFTYRKSDRWTGVLPKGAGRANTTQTEGEEEYVDPDGVKWGKLHHKVYMNIFANGKMCRNGALNSGIESVIYATSTNDKKYANKDGGEILERYTARPHFVLDSETSAFVKQWYNTILRNNGGKEPSKSWGVDGSSDYWANYTN